MAEKEEKTVQKLSSYLGLVFAIGVLLYVATQKGKTGVKF